MKWLILETGAPNRSMATALPSIVGRINVAAPTNSTSKYGAFGQNWNNGISRRSLAIKGSNGYRRRLSRTAALGPTNGALTTMAWQDCTARVEVDVPLVVAWELWSDREGLNRWMPWIASIKVLKDKPELSRWTLKYNAFGQDLEFSWLARNLQPIRNQKIHWRSEDGLENRGAVRFYPRGPSSCGVELTVSYEVPAVLSGVASALSPLVEGILQSDLDRFASFAKTYQFKASSK